MHGWWRLPWIEFVAVVVLLYGCCFHLSSCWGRPKNMFITRHLQLLLQGSTIGASHVHVKYFFPRSSGRKFSVTNSANVPVSRYQPVKSHVTLDPIIMSYLNLRPHLRKTRFLLSTKSETPVSMCSLRNMIELRYPGLLGQPYRLQYLIHGEEVNDLRTLSDNTQLEHAVKEASFKQKSLHLYVNSAIGIFPPSDFDIPLTADPFDTPSYTMVSFFSFQKVVDKSQTAIDLQSLWSPFKALGRVYVASEGVNAQMAIPTCIIEDFKRCTIKYPLFSESKFNTDPAIPRTEYFKTKPFRALHVRIRDQIVADGLDEGLDWNHAGNELDPLQWHEALENPNAIILDCRNSYETDVGKFDGAIPLNTTFFRESWVALEEILKDKPRNMPVLTYCTGGIRCVKINAYLEQKMGFTNTHRLKGGIIAYRRELEKIHTSPSDRFPLAPCSSKFKGGNYVFDERLVERITGDCFAYCETCGVSIDSFTNCKNARCNVRFVQCSNCRVVYDNCCSLSCTREFDISKNSDLSANMMKLKQLNRPHDNKNENRNSEKLSIDPIVVDMKSHAMSHSSFQNAVLQYCEEISDQEPEYLRNLRVETIANFHSAKRMLSGPSQGAFLSFLATLHQAQTILELGTFTGYSAMSLATDFQDFTAKNTLLKSLQNSTQRIIHTCEIDARARQIAESAISRSIFKDNIQVHPISADEMLEKSRQVNMKFDMVFIDADKRNYINYLQQLVGEGTGHSLLNSGAVIIVDNTLWKGLVLSQVPELEGFAPDAAEFGAAGRFSKIAGQMHSFNKYCSNREDLTMLLLPLRDGLTILRYRR